MTEELTLKVTDLERKAIAFCCEKDVPFPIANYLVAFATEATKKLQEENKKYKEMVEDMKADMCSTKSETLCDYLKLLLKKYDEIY